MIYKEIFCCIFNLYKLGVSDVKCFMLCVFECYMLNLWVDFYEVWWCLFDKVNCVKCELKVFELM